MRREPIKGPGAGVSLTVLTRPQRSTCSMKRRSPSSREALLCRLLEKVESNGGEEWLMRCLEESSTCINPPWDGGRDGPGRGQNERTAGKKEETSENSCFSSSVKWGESRRHGNTECTSSEEEQRYTASSEVANEQLAAVTDGEKCMVSEFSYLVYSLSNVLQQFKGAHASGANNIIKTQGAQVSGAGNILQPKRMGIGEFSGAQVLGAEKNIQMRGAAVAECQRAQVTGACNMMYNDTDKIHTGAHSYGAMDNMQFPDYMADVGSIWQGLSEPALQDEDREHLARSKVINPPLLVNPSLPLRPSALTVGESSFKEPLPCVLSPLSFHLPKTVKDKIWRGKFIDISSLLPASKDFLSKTDKQSGDRSEEDSRRSIPKPFQNWLQAFCIYAAVMGECFPGKCSGLFQHLDIIAEAFRHFGGSAWYTYDENFRQKLAVHPSLHWGSKDVGLWLNLMLPPRPQFTPRLASNPQTTFRKGFCFAFNEGQCKFLTNCRYKHECSYCNGNHAANRCFRKSAATSFQPFPRDAHGKGTDSSEPNKNAPMVRALSQSQDGGSTN